MISDFLHVYLLRTVVSDSFTVPYAGGPVSLLNCQIAGTITVLRLCGYARHIWGRHSVSCLKRRASGHRNSIQILMYRSIHISKMRGIDARHETGATDRLGARHNARIGEGRNSARRKLRQIFFGANRNCQALSRTGPRRRFNTNKQKVAVRRPCWNTVT